MINQGDVCPNIKMVTHQPAISIVHRISPCYTHHITHETYHAMVIKQAIFDWDDEVDNTLFCLLFTGPSSDDDNTLRGSFRSQLLIVQCYGLQCCAWRGQNKHHRLIILFRYLLGVHFSYMFTNIMTSEHANAKVIYDKPYPCDFIVMKRYLSHCPCSWSGVLYRVETQTM